jgi:UDP-glucose 4-epimerase
LSRGHRDAVAPAARLVEGDISDRPLLDRLFRAEGFEAVLHFAALIEAGESMIVPERYFRHNTAFTLTLLETMIEHRVRKLVFSSTAALYGEPREIPITEGHPLGPTNVYGESKRMVESMLGWFGRLHGLRHACLRYFNAAGASGDLGEDHRPESHLIPLVLAVAQGKRNEVKIHGTDYPTPDGTCVRDYVHVEDLAQAHLLALDALGEREALAYNLGNGQGFSVRQVVEAARRVTGHSIPAVESPRRPGDPATLVASSDRIRAELGWAPRRPDLEDIVASAWAWRMRNPEGYRE